LEHPDIILSKNIYPLFVGTTGWSHQEWKGYFYPRRMKPSEYLSYYSSLFNCVEADSTFYNIPSIQLTQSWNEKTPDQFLFCPKVPRSITHEAHLRDCQSEVTLFLQALTPIHHKLGRIMLQLAPSYGPQFEVSLKKFIQIWPEQFPLAIDFPHPGWIKSRIAHFLKERNIPWVWPDNSQSDDKAFAALNIHPRTSSDLYIRLLGPIPKLGGAFPQSPQNETVKKFSRDLMIQQWKETIKNHLQAQGTVFCICNPHYEGNALTTVISMLNIEGFNHAPTIQLPHNPEEQLNLPDY